MKLLRIEHLKCILIFAHFALGEVAGEERDHVEKYNVVTNETIATHLWNITVSYVTIPYNNSLESENICEPNPCMNNGMCLHSGKEIYCICKPPFVGSRCQISPCKPNPCKNNGQCEINEEGFTCKCPESFVGELCEIVLDLCEENPCKNNGECLIENGQLKCDCNGPYAGKYCEKDCDCGDAVCELDSNGNQKECNCTENQILYEGKCVDCDCGNASCQLDNNGKKKCICQKNQTLYMGKCVECDCGERSRLCYFDNRRKKQCVCLPGSAQLEGTCSVCSCGENSRSCLFNATGEVVCYCKKGFSQKNNTCYENCHDDHDCLNWGICRKEDFGSFCNCSSGFSGGRCQVDDICQSMKEQCDAMGAVCKRDGAIGLCVCPKGRAYSWRSGVCEDVCDARKCNQGSCVVARYSYICICKSGFRGKHCDEMIKQVKKNPDVTYDVVVLVILCIAIVGFFIGTICLIQRNRKLIKSLKQTSANHEPRI